MNFLKPDSPVMNFLSILADLIILNLLFIICSLPIVTFGAAYSAKYYVAMKIMRGEDTGTIIPFFKAFGRNFKQATVSWMIMLLAIALDDNAFGYCPDPFGLALDHRIGLEHDSFHV